MTTAVAPPDTPAVTVTASGRWRGVLGFMDAWSADVRMLESPEDGAPVRIRPLPLPLLVQPELAPGHDGAKLGVGVIDRIWTEQGFVMGEGRFDMDDPIGAELARKVGEGFIRFVSLDVDDATAHQVCVGPNGELLPDCDPNDPAAQMGMVYTGWRVMGATLLAHPAFPDAHIALADDNPEQAAQSAQAAVRLAEGDLVVPGEGGPEIVGYDPAWGCVVPNADGSAWEPAECELEGAVPANATGDGPFDPEQVAAATAEPVREEVVEDEGTGCVAPDPAAEGAWVPVDCTAEGAVPANAEGTAPAEEVTEAANEADTETLATTDTTGQEYALPMLVGEDTPEGESADADSPQNKDQGNGCVCEQEDATWQPCDCALDDAVTADAEGNPVQDDEDAMEMAAVPDGCEPCKAVAITASGADPTALTAAATGWTPPASYFNEPPMDQPEPITVDPVTGQLSGLLAVWGTCHVGFRDRCVTPPRSASGYGFFHTARIPTDQGALDVGLITMDTGHADLDLTAASTISHYDNTGTQAAVVRVGENEHGIWVAGVTLPFVTEEERLRLSLASFSGDWRQIRGGAELVAALAVNTPGFPMPARKTGTDNVEYALVAAGALPPAIKPPPAPAPETATAAAPVDTGTWARIVIAELDARDQRAVRLARLNAKFAAAKQAMAADRIAGATRSMQALAGSLAADRITLARQKVTGLDIEIPKGIRATKTDLELTARPDFQNWVDQQGGLPRKIKSVADKLKAKGMGESQAIATAVNVARKACASGDTNWPGKQQMNPKSKAEYCAAIARWEAMKAAANAS